MTVTAVPGACPLDCPDTCAWTVTVRDGQAVELRGNREHPFTKGALCVKVNRYLDHTRAPDRLLYPLRRVGRKGEGRFERIGWDQALDTIADRLADVVERHGGEAIWPYYGTGTMGYLQGLSGGGFGRFWNALGASQHEAYGICSRAGGFGLGYTLGTSAGMDPEDFAHARLILLWGTNTLTSGHHLWKFIQAAQRSGAYLVAIDPIRTRTAERADEHLAPVPGTDAALALGLLNVIVAEGAEDRDYLERHTLGWEPFRDRVAGFTPERVAAITGLPAERIVALGRRIAHTRPTAIRATMGLQRHAGGGTALRTLACIPGVTGDWGRPGGGLSYSTGAFFGLNKPALTRPDLRPHPVRTLQMTRLGEGLLDLADPPVKALFVLGANPMASTPHHNRVRAGLLREDLFTVVVEQFPTDTVDYADIVLPSTMQTEHADVHAGYGHLYLAWNEPAVPPPGECLPTTETLRRLATRMGLREPSLYDTDEELAEQLLTTDDPSLTGITLDALRKQGWARLNVPRPFLPFRDGFPTPSGRLEFYSARAARDGLDPLAGYTPASEVDDVDRARRYPLVLLATASHFFLNTVFGNAAAQRKRAGEPHVLLHPSDAADRGLVDGQRVRVFNDRGAHVTQVRLSDRVRPGVAATTKGHWPKLLATGSNINATVDERDTDMGGGAVFHDNRVQIEPAPEP
ncbi:molybdopterin-containing oxidoreductase family protein [Pseudonocardia acaciae]|uniref:molybdopterin-containing oxidoreductase family protein n=1 Tax=Pseudonocardia acaciae TaxID=551276 RepID=UPI00048F963E|nr:molybdopterin oxidoreductase family protein [Pseudonocardia acaciae]